MSPKPCPFCGGRAEAMDAASGRQNWVECLTALCRAMGPNLASPQEAVTAWNRREPPKEEETGR